jgi:hypothetical protein
LSADRSTQSALKKSELNIPTQLARLDAKAVLSEKYAKAIKG